MRHFILTCLIFATCQITFAQDLPDTVNNNALLNAKCADNLVHVISKKDYSAHTFVLNPETGQYSKAAHDNPQITQVVMKNYPPVMKKNEVLYHVVEIKKTLIYPTMNYSMETFNLLLYDKELKPLFISIRYTSDTSNNFSFVGVYQDQYLEFSNGKGKRFYISPPNTNPDPSANYLELHGKKMCFYEVPQDQVNVSVNEIHLPLQHKYVFCSEAYGVKSVGDH